MPSVSVPLKGAKGWDVLMQQRRDFWAKPGNMRLTAHFQASEFYTHDGTPCPTTARNGMVRLCRDYLEPMRTKFGGTAYVRETRRRRRRRSLPAAGLRSHRQPQLQSRLVRMTAALGDTVAVILIVFALAMAAIVVWRIVARGNPRIRRIRLGVFYERETDELGELTPDERYERLPR
jgi:hypothetical protein